jgi:hypothetical protein
MRVERTGEAGLGAQEGVQDFQRLEEFLRQAGGPEAALEALAVREQRTQRRSAAALQRIEAQARKATLRKSLEEMESAAGWRKWSGIASMLTQAAQSAISAAGSGEGGGGRQGADAAQAGAAIAGGACQVALNGEADQDDRAATWMQAESEQRLAEARSAEEWLREARAAEVKLLERLEAYLRAEHEGRMACLRG